MLILVVDDDPAVLAFMAGAFRRSHRVMVADSVAAARELWDVAGGVDLVVSDWHVGAGDGLALLAELRGLGLARGLLVSGNPGGAVRLPAGLAFLAKPFTVARLRAAVDAIAEPIAVGAA